MIENFDQERLATSAPGEMGELLESGHIIHFPVCPIELPDEADLKRIREELPHQLKRKNVSFHPEAGSIRGMQPGAPLHDLALESLRTQSDRISAFLGEHLTGLFDNATVGTCSFRPVQEQGRNLKPHASNELIHIDAGAYGATNGDRLLRFFINYSTDEDRVWVTRGSFPDLLEEYKDAAGLAGLTAEQLRKGPLGYLRTGMLHSIDKLGLPLSKALDSSPYDRAMRRFHNFMKDTPEFQTDPRGRIEMRFKPMSAWMVFTDMVSHACISGQHCINYTAVVPLTDCQHPEMAPYNLLSAQAA